MGYDSEAKGNDTIHMEGHQIHAAKEKEANPKKDVMVC